MSIDQAETLDQPFAASEGAQKCLAIRSVLHRAIYGALREYRLSNMGDEDGNPYPLVDLLSNPAPSDIGTGEMQMIELADDIAEAIAARRAILTTEPTP